MINYKLAIGRSPGDLQNIVTEAISKGYKPQGGASINGPFYIQALIMEVTDAAQVDQRENKGQGKDILTPEPLSGAVGKVPDVIRRKGHKV